MVSVQYRDVASEKSGRVEVLMAMSIGGVEMEEKGERYGDGDKVRQHLTTGRRTRCTHCACRLNDFTNGRWICTRERTISNRHTMRLIISEQTFSNPR